MVNMLISGTPGTGKSTICRGLMESIEGYTYVCVGDLVKEKALYEGRDEAWDTYIIDEDALLDELEPMIAKGNLIVEHHGSDFFPERFFQLVVVLRTSNNILHPRLSQRSYSEKKVSENVSAEILQVCLDEALDSYKEEIVWELRNDTLDEMEANITKISEFIRNQ
eukprot:TRINITY_DN6492_c0_g1_i1.p1 TRINITY_DN6492_c0_g1~~TRINITY_DN6492_c0_g1_i1.p1  ORF type:complete len:181 (-),score=51.42 TRINITY_DN6492_c0_g1_i1:42-539(-)